MGFSERYSMWRIKILREKAIKRVEEFAQRFAYVVFMPRSGELKGRIIENKLLLEICKKILSLLVSSDQEMENKRAFFFKLLAELDREVEPGDPMMKRIRTDYKKKLRSIQEIVTTLISLEEKAHAGKVSKADLLLKSDETLRKVIVIAEEAGTILLRYYRKEVKAVSKDKERYDPVTEADREADHWIRERLAGVFPADQILSEENKSIPFDFLGRVWMVDPLDGTKTFLRKEDGFAVNIGLCKRGRPVLGVVYAPARGEMYFAKRGEGAFLQKEGRVWPIRTTEICTIEESRAFIKPSEEKDHPINKIARLQVKENMTGDCAALRIIKIARGLSEFYIDISYKASKWDTCAPQVILEEAGGTITDLLGNPLDYKDRSSRLKNSFVASNTVLHPALIKEILKLPKPVLFINLVQRA